MTEPAARKDTVSCHSCGAVLGTLNRGDPLAARRGLSSRIIATEPRVRIFVDLVMGRAEFFCPSCGACGRTVRADTIRGIILHISEVAEGAC